ncbi:putative bifunctional diguanylate cyclase/phosphodiesterase [Aquabacterium sp.]|uniref:putative bifunctional diguanylate cyclase/phosphodiesterase n=1 Tax=Aquabacterium sp. TaxID=1872578 RepID=UPI0035C6AEB5
MTPANAPRAPAWPPAQAITQKLDDMNALDLPPHVRQAASKVASQVATQAANQPTLGGRLDQARILDTLIHNLDGMAYRCLPDADWTMLFVSQGCQALTGYAPRELVQGGWVTWEEITLVEDRQRVREHIGQIVRVGQVVHMGQRFEVHYRIRCRNGEVRWVLERGVFVVDENGRPVMEGYVQDITERVMAQQALEEAEQRYRQIFEHASEGMFQSSRDGRYLAANQALARMYGYASPQELIANLSDIGHVLYVQPSRRQEFCQRMEVDGKVSHFESEVYRRDGSRIWISESARAVRSPSGQFICYEGTVQDVTERRTHQAQLERQANHDQLTGLPRRHLLADRLQQAMRRADRSGERLALVFIDLDNFKYINDTLGHAAGDQLLVEVAQRLSHNVRASDTVARQGGDEFVLLLNDLRGIDTLISQLERLVEVIGRPLPLSGRTLQVGASLGVALYPQDGVDVDTLLKHADVAMYAAKHRGKNNFQFFTPELNRVASERMHLEAAMRVGLDHGEFSAHFQPKVDGAGHIVGVEALARWHHPLLGHIAPDRFIPIAEESGLILPLTEAIARQACAAALDWPQVNGRDITLALNLSPKLFIDPQLVAKVSGWLQRCGLPAHRVELEITESVFLEDHSRAMHTLRAFKALGCRLAMDDFGTGYSSLSYLRHFPLDTIKVDRSLVTDLETASDAAMIARAVVSLGKSLGKTVVAEGVEHHSQLDFLKAQGCDEFQGYLFARPMAAADLAQRLHEGGTLLA